MAKGTEEEVRKVRKRSGRHGKALEVQAGQQKGSQWQNELKKW